MKKVFRFLERIMNEIQKKTVHAIITLKFEYIQLLLCYPVCDFNAYTIVYLK